MKILIKAVAGSHLFGTNTPTSDRDYKGVFLPEESDILLGKFDQTVHDHTNTSTNKNTKDDIDIEFYSLDKFLKMLYQGQTVAWELLFTPENMIIEKHPLWDEIKEATPLFLNKRVDAFIGYCKQQAHKYGVRGSRLSAVEQSLEIFNRYNWNQYLSDVSAEDIKTLESFEHIEWVEKEFMGSKKQLLSICGKKFESNTMLKYVKDPLNLYYNSYGERSRLAQKNEGVDWKALSHAVRVCMQASSLLTKGKIMLPMHPSQVTLLKGIKAGQLTFDVVANLIEEYQSDLLKDRDNSTLPEEPELKNFQDIQIRIYSMIIKGEV